MVHSSQLPQKETINVPAVGIPKASTHIQGLDVILEGGLPLGRVTLLGGGPGTGKTVFGLEFLYRGALSGEPGIFLTFEEDAENIRRNALALGWDLTALEASGRFAVIEGVPDRNVVLSGEFNLMGCLSIIEGKAREVGARRIVIDALDMLMGLFDDPLQAKQQILFLQDWLANLGLTTVLTTKFGKEATDTAPFDDLDFLVDCVIYLDQRNLNQVSTRRMQIIKYRGSTYGSNEYPYLVTGDGLYFYAVSDMALDFEKSSERLASGNAALDDILGGGFFQGSSVMISGMTGTGKTSIAATFAQAACDNDQRVLYINFEESPNSMVASMRSIGLDLERLIEADRLSILAAMPESRGIEMHLYDVITAIERFGPDHLVVDAISACKRIAGKRAAFDLVMRLVNHCKRRGITVVLINQTINSVSGHLISGIGISSVVDTIITLTYQDHGDETFRSLKVLKSRGSRHSSRRHDFGLSEAGVRIGNQAPDRKEGQTA